MSSLSEKKSIEKVHENLYLIDTIITILFPPTYISIMMAWREDIRRRIILDSGSYSIRVGNAGNPVPNLIYDNFMAIDRNTGNKIFGPALDSIIDETKLIYEKNNVRGVTVRFESYLSMLDDLMARLEMPKKTTGFYCEDFSMTLPILPFHPRKVMERHMEIYL